MSHKAQFLHVHPGSYFLDPSDRRGLLLYLRERGWIDADESILDARRAGDGNMNLAVRIVTPWRSFILKQSRPWVEKYPHIAAPAERAVREGEFYELVSSHPPVASMMPQLLGLDRRSALLMMEDLGSASDFTWMYSGRSPATDHFHQLLHYLTELHRNFTGYEPKAAFANRAMRELNHQHIFHIPLIDNGLDLDGITPGLAAQADALKRERRYVDDVARLGQLYLADGRALLHGDYFPGSWLNVGNEVRVIDPEFCFFGPPEFDVGVMAAHLLLSHQGTERVRQIFDIYRPDVAFDRHLAARFAGVELMRRLIGVAQLPLTARLADINAKRELLDLSRRLLGAADAWEAL